MGEDNEIKDIEFTTTYITIYYLKKLLDLKIIELKNREKDNDN